MMQAETVKLVVSIALILLILFSLLVIPQKFWTRISNFLMRYRICCRLCGIALKRWVISSCVLISAVLGAVCFIVTGGRGHTPEEKAAMIDRAYISCEKAVDDELAEVDRWYKEVIDTNAEKAASALIDLRAKVELLKDPFRSENEKKMQKFLQERLEKNLYTQAEKQKVIAGVIGSVVLQWMDIENTLAKETHCYALTTEAKVRAVEANHASLPGDGVDDELKKDIYREIASNVGGEVATMVAVQLATSAGILGTSTAISWGTFGISLAAGIVVDVIVGKIMDAEGKVKQKLVASLEAERDDLKAKLRDALMEALRKRRVEWEKQI